MIGQTTRGLLKGLAILIGILVVGIIIAAPFVFLHNFKQYDNAKERFHLRYPSDWEPQHPRLDNTIVIFMSPRGDETEMVANVTITYTDFAQQPMTMKEYADTAIRQTTAVFKDMVPEKPRPMNISGHPGYKLVFNSSATPKLTFVFYAFMFDNTAYNITYVGKTERFQRIDKYIVEVMIRSLKVDF